MPPKKNTDRLLSLIERVEDLEERKRAIAGDIAEVYKEAKSAGFDPKIMRIMVRERRMTDEQRAEEQALVETYRAALGMLDGTPLGDAARRRLQQKPDPAPGDGADEAGTSAGPDSPDEPRLDVPPPPVASPEDITAARAEGAVAAKTGRRVTDNPHPAGDPRRAAWDEGWCAASASDGMDVPAAWRRSKPPPKGDAPPGPPGPGE